jgi:glycosyltransferase involved in cell wall biosynthesis
MTKRIFYLSAGRANLVRSHEFWARGEDNSDEVSLTFSGQIETFVAELGAEALMVSERADGAGIRDGRFTIEHWQPMKESSGLAYYGRALVRALQLVRAARRFKADVAIVDSGALPYFLFGLFRLAGLPVILVLHNTIWPHGFRPHGGRAGLISYLDGLVIGRLIDVAIGVSPECVRQVDELAPGHRCVTLEARAQFEPDYFAAIPPPPDWGAETFNIMFIGRIHREKGVLDFPDMARLVEKALPGRVRWTICGRGPDLDALRGEVAKGLDGIVDVRGWVSLEDLQTIYAQSHASIVPTRSLFAEGLAMTAAEAILAGRPLVTNPVVPAHELLAPATILGRTNDMASHAEAVIRLASDRALYERLRDATAELGKMFYDRSQGLTAVLHQSMSIIERRRH